MANNGSQVTFDPAEQESPLNRRVADMQLGSMFFINELKIFELICITFRSKMGKNTRQYSLYCSRCRYTRKKRGITSIINSRSKS